MEGGAKAKGNGNNGEGKWGNWESIGAWSDAEGGTEAGTIEEGRKEEEMRGREE